MVVSKTEFNDALNQINESYAKHAKRIEQLEAKVEELESQQKPAAKKATPRKTEAA